MAITCSRNSVASHSSFVVWITSLIVLLSRFVITLSSIGCFKCVSTNGNNPACDDPFHNNYTTEIYESPCMGGRKGRNGLFPATACIKVTGTYEDTGVQIMVRSCALDSGTLTTDTELIRMSHCGYFYLDERYFSGCVQSCDNADGCNSSLRNLDPSPILVFTMVTASIIIWWQQQQQQCQLQQDNALQKMTTITSPLIIRTT